MKTVVFFIGAIVFLWLVDTIYNKINNWMKEGSWKLDEARAEFADDQKYRIFAEKHLQRTGEVLTREQFEDDEERAWFLQNTK